jgi:hypothetical protein
MKSAGRWHRRRRTPWARRDVVFWGEWATVIIAEYDPPTETTVSAASFWQSPRMAVRSEAGPCALGDRFLCPIVGTTKVRCEQRVGSYLFGWIRRRVRDRHCLRCSAQSMMAQLSTGCRNRRRFQDSCRRRTTRQRKRHCLYAGHTQRTGRPTFISSCLLPPTPKGFLVLDPLRGASIPELAERRWGRLREEIKSCGSHRPSGPRSGFESRRARHHTCRSPWRLLLPWE